MDVADGRDDAVVDPKEWEKMQRRKKKVAQEAAVVHGLLERKGGRGSSVPARQQQKDRDEACFISSLLTESETLGRNGIEPAQNHLSDDEEGEPKRSKNKEAELLREIAKDVKKIKRQNRITHALLGVVIVMTAVWQVNEVSFLLWVHKKLSNPFKSLGDLIGSVVKMKLGRRQPPVIESSPLPPVGIPDVTRADLPTLVISGDHGYGG